MQLSGNWQKASLADLHRGEEGIIRWLDLPGPDARRLMELGFLPGATVIAGQAAPGGGPRVFQIDGSQIALRHDTQVRIGIDHA